MGVEGISCSSRSQLGALVDNDVHWLWDLHYSLFCIFSHLCPVLSERILRVIAVSPRLLSLNQHPLMF